jgi:MFS family permease
VRAEYLVPVRTRLESLLPDVRGLSRPFWVLFAGTFVNRVGGFVLIFLAIYLTERRGLTPPQAGAVVAAYGIGAIGAGPIGGALSDRIGRRPTLALSLLGGGASIFVLGLMTRATTIMAAAISTGLLYEMYRPVVSATIADVVPVDARLRAYGLIYWAVNLGASIAALLGGVLAAYSYRLLFAVDAITTAVFGIVLWAALPETRPAAPAHDRADQGAVRAILRDRVFVAVSLLTFWFSLVFFQAFAGLPIDMRAHGISTAEFGGLLAINGILIVMLQPFAGEVVRERSRTLVLALASLILGVGFGLNAWVGTVLGYAGAIAVWTIGEILFAPVSTSLVADLAPAHLRGVYQGVFAVVFTSAFAAAPAVGGYIMANAGARWLWIDCFATCAAVASGFLMLSRAGSGTL